MDIYIYIYIYIYIQDRGAVVLVWKEVEMLHTLAKVRSGDVKKTVKKTRKEDEM